jgi:hypothetical protein
MNFLKRYSYKRPRSPRSREQISFHEIFHEGEVPVSLSTSSAQVSIDIPYCFRCLVFFNTCEKFQKSTQLRQKLTPARWPFKDSKPDRSCRPWTGGGTMLDSSLFDRFWASSSPQARWCFVLGISSRVFFTVRSLSFFNVRSVAFCTMGFGLLRWFSHVYVPPSQMNLAIGVFASKSR